MAKRVIVDENTGNLTLVDIVEETTVRALDDDDAGDPGSPPLVLVRWELLSLWARDDFDSPETASMVVKLLLPDGSVEEMNPMDIDLTEHPRTRVLINIGHLPFSGGGEYVFSIHRTTPSTKVEPAAMAEIPITIRVHDENALEP